MASEECRKKSANIGQLETELENEENRCRKLKGVKHDAAIILRHILSVKTNPVFTALSDWRQRAGMS